MSRLNTKRRRQRGNVAILSALLLTMLLGFAALAVDMSNKYRVRTESQSAADAAALAGAGQLRGDWQGLFEARQAARTVGEKHYAYQSNVTVADSDIKLGEWDPATRTVKPAATPERTNAVEVRHEEAAVAHPFASSLTDTSSSPVAAVAVALGGGPSTVACAFPLALGSCTLEGGSEDNNCGGCLTMGTDNTDNVGWALFGKQQPSTQKIADALKAACFSADGETPSLDAEGRCTNQCSDPPVAGRDTMNLGNGNDFNQNKDQFCKLVESLLRASPTHTVRTQVPVFESVESGNKCNPKFSLNDQMAVGFAEMELLGVKCGKNEPAFPDPAPKVCDAPAEKYIIARINCGTKTDLPAGGRSYGVSARPVLIK